MTNEKFLPSNVPSSIGCSPARLVMEPTSLLSFICRERVTSIGGGPPPGPPGPPGAPGCPAACGGHCMAAVPFHTPRISSAHSARLADASRTSKVFLIEDLKVVAHNGASALCAHSIEFGGVNSERAI